mmetsp:Transcript_16970/g.32200  ORF Transcript_16970/g.32200 Transcript_16970/m.32200 type:complete len:112 (+) Transcript_16970:871-1206(+)
MERDLVGSGCGVGMTSGDSEVGELLKGANDSTFNTSKQRDDDPRTDITLMFTIAPICAPSFAAAAHRELEVAHPSSPWHGVRSSSSLHGLKLIASQLMVRMSPSFRELTFT